MSSRVDKERRRQQRLAQERVDARRGARRKELAWYAAIAVVLVAAAVVVLVGVSRRGGGDSSTLLRPLKPGPAAAAGVPTKGLPRQIAANLHDGDKVVDGQVSRRLTALRGVPVVVNMWASWCPNCKAEFPYFQELSRKYERRVAFLGLDSQDERSGATAFLEQHPLSYPSVEDRSAAQAQQIGAGRGRPTTIFYDHTGRRTFVHEGAYTTTGALEADLRRYAMGA